MGLRFRVDWLLPRSRRRADLAFVASRVVVFVDGCFWHACPKHASWPKANADWWRAKIQGNVRRDRDTDARLRTQGWTVLRFWEHDDSERAAKKIARAMRSHGRSQKR
jgi:DNA mismatch endonuclease (patch repair protein)